MIEEERLEEQGFILKTFPWHEEQEVSLVKTLTGEGTLGSDVPFPGAAVAAEEIAGLRYSPHPGGGGALPVAGGKGVHSPGADGHGHPEGGEGVGGRGKALP